MPFKALVTLDVNLQAFSQNDIMKRIPQNVLDEIKQKDDHPFFQMYSVAHEGESRPKVLGKGFTPITWTRNAIHSIKNVMRKGIKFFDGHNISNNIQDKKELGVVIHAFEEEIGGKLHSVTIGYFPPETREIAKTKDICSQEAGWDLIKAGGKIIADACNSFTGIALANSNDDIPAFKDAKRLAFVQALENKPGEGDSPKSEGNGELQMNYNEILKSADRDVVRRLVSDLQLHPNQLFDLKGIQEDREFGKFFEELETTKNSLQENLKELEGIKTKNNQLDRVIQLNTAKGKLGNIYEELKTTDNIKTFIDNIYDKNKDTIQDLSEEGLRSFVANQTEIYQLANKGPGDGETPPTLPTGDGSVDSDPSDYNKASNNPLLEDDYNPEG
jgi:hypothetical protein